MCGTNDIRDGKDKKYGAAERGLMKYVVIFAHDLKWKNHTILQPYIYGDMY